MKDKEVNITVIFHKHTNITTILNDYNFYLQIFKQKLLTEIIKNAKQQGLCLRNLRSCNQRCRVQGGAKLLIKPENVHYKVIFRNQYTMPIPFLVTLASTAIAYPTPLG